VAGNCWPIRPVGGSPGCFRKFIVASRRKLHQAAMPRVNPTHPDPERSAGLHLFQELSTLGQQVAHTLLLRQGLGHTFAAIFTMPWMASRVIYGLSHS
jgi:hypothetical protein